MRLKKVWKKDKQFQQSHEFEHSSTGSNKQSLLSFFVQLKTNFMSSNSEATLQQLTVIDLTQRNGGISLQSQQLVDKFLEQWISVCKCEPSSDQSESQKGIKEIISYFVQIALFCKNAFHEEDLWSCRQLLVLGQKIHLNIGKLSGLDQLNLQWLKALIFFNNALCYTQLHMLNDAVGSLQRIQKMESANDFQAQRIISLKNLLLFQMGKTNMLCNPQSQSKKKKSDFRLSKAQQFIEIVSQSKEHLLDYVQNIKDRPLFIENAYNLALLCKQYYFFIQAKTILLALLDHPQITTRPLFHKRTLVLMSLTCKKLRKYTQSINYLELVTPHGPEEELQIKTELWYLKKKLVYRKAVSSCPKFHFKPSKKENMMEQLEKQLDLLTRKSQARPIKHRKLTETIYQPLFKKKKLTKMPSVIKLVKEQSTVQIILDTNTTGTESQLPLFLNTLDFLKKSSSKKGDLTLQTQEADIQLKSKNVQFRSTIVEESLLEVTLNFIYQNQQKIMGSIIQEKKDETLSYITQALQKIEEYKQQIPSLSQHKFKLKCAAWCRQIGQNSQACSILEKYLKELPPIGADGYRMNVMKELSSLYEEMNDYRQALKINLELVSAGEIDYLQRVGEMAISRQFYSDAVQYYQQYYQMKKDTRSLVRLAHAYSKICTHTRVAMQILNELLFINRNTIVFRSFDQSQQENIQSAVLLLASLYMSSKSMKKGQEICQKYLKINFSAYPVYYFLGLMHIQYGNQQIAFNYFVNALKLKPNHLPSLLQTVKYIGLEKSKNSQILSLVRRAFVYNHRNWEVLQLLVQIVSNEKREMTNLSLKRLMESARVLEEAGGEFDDFQLESELIWMWALEYIEQKKHHMPCFDKELITICIRLAEINLNKGNFSSSEMYFKKVKELFKEEKYQGSNRKVLNVKLELQILDRLAFIKLMQERQQEALVFLKESQMLAENNDLEIWAAQISSKIRHLGNNQSLS